MTVISPSRVICCGGAHSTVRRLVAPDWVKLLSLQFLSTGTIFSLPCSPGARHRTC